MHLMIMSNMQAGNDIDAFCTKCRLLLTHVIVALDVRKKTPRQIAKVQCKTCGSLHGYKAGSQTTTRTRDLHAKTLIIRNQATRNLGCLKQVDNILELAGAASTPLNSSRANLCMDNPRASKVAAKAVKAPKSAAKDKNNVRQQTAYEYLLNNKDLTQAKHYRSVLTFNKGDVISHVTFGVGIVTRILDAHKLEIIFRDGPKILAHNREMS